jgi:hypothetical protein
VQRVDGRRGDRDVRDAEIPCEELHVRERIAFARGEDARDRRQLGHRLRQQVDAVRPERADLRHVGSREQRAAREARIERAESGDVVLIEQAVADAR